MINLLLTTFARTRPAEAWGVHFHVDDAGHRFACHSTHCRPERSGFHRPLL
jgi:hypothetical protein